MEHGVVVGGGGAKTRLEGSPAEDVEGEVGVRLVAEGGVDVSRGEARAETGDPGLELLLEGSK